MPSRCPHRGLCAYRLVLKGLLKSHALTCRSMTTRRMQTISACRGPAA